MNQSPVPAFLFLLGALTAEPLGAQPARSCTVERIVDGDTFVCADGERVRLLLVNAPEMGDEPLGDLAREFVRDRVPPGTRVRLEPDLRERDRYGRLLAYVHLPDGRMLNRMLARHGYGQVMVVPPDVRHVAAMRAAADSARSEGAGLWGRTGFGGEEEPRRRAARRGAGEEGCHPSYPDVCIPAPPPELDCGDVAHRRFRVVGSDPHRFDGDGNGVGCEGGRGTAAVYSSFAALVERLSGPAGHFDTDNLISNETSYLHVVGALERIGVRGGAYIGVGPDQNFSYIARIRPEVAFIVDVRRDNLLQHLLFKALFELAADRAEYLALWTGREAPVRPGGWSGATVEELVAAVDAAPATPESGEEAVRRVLASVLSYGLELPAGDLSTIERFHRAFIRSGLDLRFTSHGRPPRPFYPTLRELILARDLQGRRSNYLARSDDFRFLKRLQARHGVVPVVGDLAGAHALPAVGDEIRRRGLVVSAFYTSNVEFYLMWRGGGFSDFARTAAALPRDERSVIIRSCFSRCRASHPRSVPGHGSVQLLQRIEDFAEAWEEGGFAGYLDLVTRESLELR